MNKQIIYREVRLSDDTVIDQLTDKYWEAIDDYLNGLGFDRSAIIGKVRIQPETEICWGESEPYICALFSTLESDFEYKQRLDFRAKQEENERAQYEKLKAKFED